MFSSGQPQRMETPTVATTMPTGQSTCDATAGYEADLRAVADVIRNSMGTAEYERVLLGLNLLEHVSDAVAESHAAVFAECVSEAGEDCDEHVGDYISRVPREAGRAHLTTGTRQPTIGRTLGKATA